MYMGLVHYKRLKTKFIFYRMEIERTRYTQSLQSVLSKIKPMDGSNQSLGDQVCINKVHAVLITITLIPGYLTEYLLTCLMRTKGVRDTFFSMGRHNSLGTFDNRIVMYSKSTYRLATAIEVWQENFDGMIQMLTDIELPEDDICSPFHFAIEGPVRLSRHNMKRPNLFVDPNLFWVFTIPKATPRIWSTSAPGYCLVGAPWNVKKDQWEFFFELNGNGALRR